MFSLKDYCHSNEGMRFSANTALLCNAVAGFNYEHKQRDTTFFFAVALRPNAGHGLLILEVF